MIGDVIGAPGRKMVKQIVPALRAAARLDFVTANAENLAGGFGITEKTYGEIMLAGVDAATMGNHWKDKPDIHLVRKNSTALVLPQNLPDLVDVERIPEFELPERNKKVCVLNLMGLFAMKDNYNNPYEFLAKNRAQLSAKFSSGQYIVIADVHAEGSSEKQVMAWYLNGLASALIGTHTHTPTSDERVTQKGTAFLTDVGMTGPYESVIGMTIERTLPRYFPPVEKKPLEVAKDDLWFCGFLVEICPHSCLALRAHRLQYRASPQLWSLSSVSRQ